MARILVIEDEKDIQDVLAYNLAQAGHKVQIASRGDEGLRFARERKPDLILLDLMLPDLPGTEVCKQLRSQPSMKDVKIVMLTAKGEEIDRVVGFELGADDYIVKPFSVRELVLRIQAVLRRAAGEEQPQPMLEFGILRVDREAHRAWVDSKEVELTALEFKLLVMLHDRRNRVQTREALLQDVWAIDADITTRTVDTHVLQLRTKLDPSLIESVRGVGYRLAPETKS